MRVNIETVKTAAKDLVTSATSVATLSTSEQSEATIQVEEPIRPSEDRVGLWLSHTSEGKGNETASSHSTESTRLDSVFSEPEHSLTSPTSESESFVPIPLRARGKMSTSRESRGSITSEHSSVRKREMQDDRDFSIVLSNMGKWEKSAQSKLLTGNLAGAQQDLRNALDCRDRIASDFANNRELVVLQKLIEIGGRHLELSQFAESEVLFKYATDRGNNMSPETSDSLRGDVVAKASAIALTKLETCELPQFEEFCGIAKQHRSKMVEPRLRTKAFDDFALHVTTKACDIVKRKLEDDEHDLVTCDKLCRIALRHGDHVYRSSTNPPDGALTKVPIPQVANDIVEENIDERKFREAESLAELLIDHGKRLPEGMILEAEIPRTNFSLAYACYAQRTEEKLDKAERILSASEQWQGHDAHLVHATSYLLAQVYSKKGNLDGAENCCWTAMKGRMDLYGDDHENYLEVVDLFVRILKKQGQHQEADLNAIQLTPEYRKNRAAQWCTMHAMFEPKGDVLRRATAGGYQEAVSILLEEGIACEDLLCRAVSAGDLDSARLLLTAGALQKFDHSLRKPLPTHPIALADQSGDSEMLKLLLEKASQIKDCVETYNLTWAVRGQRTAAIAALLSSGARPDQLTNGTTLLHLAAEKDWLSTLRVLICSKPNLEVTDSECATPLHSAVLKGHKSIVTALLDAGANIEARKESFTPLHLAISEQTINIAQLLLDRGANPTLEADNGINALHLAVMCNDKSTVHNLLTRYPALINTKTRYGRTALHIALMETGFDMARLLVDRGIDVNVHTSMGNTAWDLARRREVKDKAFEKLLYGKMSPKPSKILARITHSLMTDPNRSTSFGIDY
jgi:ankyrin repeat protein